MAKVELKTKKTDASVDGFINSVANQERRADAFRLLEMFTRITGEEPKMWGPSIIGFGHRVLKYDSGRELDWMVTGFSPRKANLSLYVLCGAPNEAEYLAKLGKYKNGVSCLYIKRLSDIDEHILEQLIKASVAKSKKSSKPG
ncbi:MAG TPA: DUF1801 domain-containing protein [Pyrinomonadaceae bacterium]|nr:DUF1801 domain-containing protein [Pyrinomonadaceae bacterium]HMP65365.1 DUF1801 domain-containing protein [Pyrinomonadaceae bacterium]